MFRSLLLISLLSLAGCVDNEPPLAEERRLLLSVEGRYQKLVTYATRTIDLNIESRSSDWFYFYSGVSLSVRR